MIDYEFEDACDKAKKAWKSRYRWGAPEPEIWLSISGDLSAKTVSHITADLAGSPNNPAIISIDSPGGGSSETLQLYHAIRAHAAPTTAMCASRCYSGAVSVFLAADTRIATRSARFGVHHSAWLPI